MIRLIGLAGEARAGKSSAADFLTTELVGFEQYALAAPIKDMICALFDWDNRYADGCLKETVAEVSTNHIALVEQWEKWRMEELAGFNIKGQVQFEKLLNCLFPDKLAMDISPRRAFQLFGTEYGRGLLSTIWLDIARRKLDELPDDKGLVITDIRFPNEHKWISYNGGFLIHVRREGSQHIIGGPEHKSEAGLKKMAMDWQTPFCKNLEELEVSMKRVAQFATFSTTSDVRLSGRSEEHTSELQSH